MIVNTREVMFVDFCWRCVAKSVDDRVSEPCFSCIKVNNRECTCIPLKFVYNGNDRFMHCNNCKHKNTDAYSEPCKECLNAPFTALRYPMNYERDE